MSEKKRGSGAERRKSTEEGISPPTRRSQRKSTLENTFSDSPVCPKIVPAVSEQKMQIGIERHSQKDGDVCIISPPTRRSQRKSTLENTVSESPVCLKIFPAMSEQKKQIGVERRSQNDGDVCITSPTKRKSQRKSAMNTTTTLDSLEGSKDIIPDQQSGSSAHRQSQKGCDTGVFSPPTRKSQRKSALDNTASDSPGCVVATRAEQKRPSSTGRVSQKEQGDTCNTSPPNGKSQRKSESENAAPEITMPAPIFKRSFVVKKIMPRKTLAVSATQIKSRLTNALDAPQSTPKALNVTAAPRRSSRVSPKVQKENTIPDELQALPKGVKDQAPASITDILSPIPVNVPSSPGLDDRDHVMSQKVRRSYSRLEMSLNSSSFLYSPTRRNDSSETSTPNLTPKGGRPSLFGFEKLCSTEALEEEQRHRAETKKRTVNQSPPGACLPSEPDQNIPGVVVIKEKRRKRKVQLIEKSELDEWAALMNAEFDEAEKFNLLVE
ncbi:sororin [Bombina bombina]|uniref:sororin n=1 Tax=Bombina bombina TaxID=8345 RepID=UPI00235B109E|nr:sororin [Bombina bombina]